jgi:hypothetical protein
MVRIVWSIIATGAAALLVHFQPWSFILPSQESYRAEVEPVVNVPSAATPPTPARAVEDSAPASPVVPPNPPQPSGQNNFTSANDAQV